MFGIQQRFELLLDLLIKVHIVFCEVFESNKSYNLGMDSFLCIAPFQERVSHLCNFSQTLQILTCKTVK